MPSSTYDNYLSSVADILFDYRVNEIPARLPDDIDRWLRQFDKFNADWKSIILSEMYRILTKYYISRKAAKDFLATILNSQEIFGTNPLAEIKKTCFLDIQTNGNSQKDILVLARQLLNEKYNLPTNFSPANPQKFVYFDDCLLSGNTVLNNLKSWILQATPSSELHLVLFAAYTQGWEYVKKLKNLAEEHNINFRMWSLLALDNKKLDKIECIWPKKYATLDLEAYTAKLIQDCSSRGFSAPRTYRTVEPLKEVIFSSTKARNIVEEAFTKAGLYILSQCHNPKYFMRPLGFEKLHSFGFGSLLVTYRNCPNNCPLAWWWDLDGWLPLLPRKGRSVPQ